ncbi:hypothetical protein MAMMFC1_00509 [Methylomusa anaerophila]|uniref:Uncharacterized protein n=1 Tax=Methylomusa anaerophila TaxID=1930071 RepID=A0A348AFM1_9FIRM|nr:hypothetical protein MAMMFC1_00509 [Methylomusa anaerophila]
MRLPRSSSRMNVRIVLTLLNKLMILINDPIKFLACSDYLRIGESLLFHQPMKLLPKSFNFFDPIDNFRHFVFINPFCWKWRIQLPCNIINHYCCLLEV